MTDQPPDSCPTYPRLAFRIGITGSRRLRVDQVKRIRHQLDEVIGHIKVRMRHLTELERVKGFYASHESEILSPLLSIASPLARGADRLAAEVALEHQYVLHVPMPFPVAVYEQDFTGTDGKDPHEVPLSPAQDLAQFHRLLRRASAQISLDGAHDRDPNSTGDHLGGYSYEFVGRFVVRHSDLLIAIWDGKPSNGRGGTEEIVRYAASVGVPVFWIHATQDTMPLWVAGLQDLRDPDSRAKNAKSMLHEYVDLTVLSPKPVHRHAHKGVAIFLNWIADQHVAPAADYFKETPQPKRLIWESYSKTLDLMAGLGRWFERLPGTETQDGPAKVCDQDRQLNSTFANIEANEHQPPANSVDIRDKAQESNAQESYWPRFYDPADARAVEYANRYRSSYTLVIAFAAIGLVAGSLASLLPLGELKATTPPYETAASWCCAILELVMPFLVVYLVFRALHREWHEKSIEYRLVAELFRKQETLAPLGWALSVGSISQLADTERLRWVRWLFSAAQRSAPFPEVNLADPRQRRANRSVLLQLIDAQIKYHCNRRARTETAGTALEWLGGAIFMIVLGCVTLHFVTEIADWKGSLRVLLGLVATVFPALSAAFVGFRSYAELQLLSDQSLHMIAALNNARTRVLRLDLNRPLVSRDLGSEALAVTTLMLQDLEGWGRLFRGKSMETS